MTRFWDGRTDGRSDCTPRPAFAFGDAGENVKSLRQQQRPRTNFDQKSLLEPLAQVS